MSQTLVDDAAWASPWRHRRVGEKVLLSVGLVVTALAVPTVGDLLVAAAALALMLGPARVPLRTVAILTTAPAAFLLLGTIPIAFQGWPPTPTAAGLARAGELWVGSLAGTLALLLLATTTSLHHLVTWLHRLHVPAELVEIATLVYRALFVTLDTALALLAAHRARLGDTAPWRRRVATTAGIAATLFTRTWQRMERLHRGLEGRGYEGELRTLTPTPARRPGFVVASLALLAGIWLTGWAVRA
ncbi:cobalt ECF transporter T component CbiQ [uncultured Tessaracoccus sp.]|uniref:cobalt ECF transporter T component CbiQ n=1 Tax=uncultured Tessaracoccus sp. TaxID=905023 RepID=UPI0025F74F2E|nr:cobalt ECF transporter T component CbiQ [uncultured Tessaracoccus sp.]